MSNKYCIYKGKIYSAQVKQGQVCIVSRTKEEDFDEYVDVLGKKHCDLFSKIVLDSDIDLLFSIKCFAIYMGETFQLFSNKITRSSIENNEVCLYTDSEVIANRFGLTKREQFVFTKNVTLNEIDYFKIIRIPILMFKEKKISETIIEKPYTIDKFEFFNFYN